MRIVVVGIGKVGSTVAEYLAKEGHAVTIVDTNPHVVERMTNRYDVLGVCGNGASVEIQKEAGMAKADLVVSLTSADEFNILCCIMARKNGAQHVIARVRNPVYFQQMLFLREELGLSMAINPEMEVADAIGRMLRFPSATKLELFAKGRMEMAEVTLPAVTSLDGMALQDLQSRFGAQVLVCAVQRGQQVFIPKGNFTLQAGDHISVSAGHGDLNTFFKRSGLYRDSVRSVLIVGGGRIAYYLASQLLRLGIRVKIIEQEEGVCETLSEAMPKAQILRGDGTDQELLLEEGIDAVDACVSLTGVDEENIIVSMFASSQKVKKVITKVNRASLLNILHGVGIESAVSSRTVTGERIVGYVRGLSNSQGSNVQTLYRLLDGRMEALEFVVSEKAPFAGKTLQQLTFRPGVLIAGIVRGGKLIHPQGSDYMQPGDLVTVVTTIPGIRELGETLVEGGV